MFNEKIKELRKSRGLTQDNLASEINITRAAYSRYETGDREPDFETVKKIAEKFGVSIDYLLGTDEKLDKKREVPPEEALLQIRQIFVNKGLAKPGEPLPENLISELLKYIDANAEFIEKGIDKI